ncbi:CPBP family intramembrane metalloprotease [Elizabethkingia sp. HX XZB]|uniref:CPBP family intramembrane glutamic endopeptidase n=1 Tax=Elizabethkingia TaxID=308865 RepID=UPI001FD61819|nr:MULTISPECIES: CPBP family intramembrane glutamic endopeptidase [Elizabethkingia]MCL1656309.1 CPBP family intramembrane metalloprotease [Elizabethkingia miricola]MCP1253517.1 CPBP family intramembrane metalloprotease [Elizabethkingia sp. S0634]MDX8568327.1 CPBP family intramembrane metalloprotease [Elizabethkingia sp. HX XZB]MDX8571155.1 CPBP family intramembrane metalloprotease [Elizabethkingia sp. HX QKY]
MKFIDEIKKVNWLRILLFYGLILIATYSSRKLPNLLTLLLGQFTDIHFPWNYNHGIAILIISFLFYKFSGVKQEITLLGSNKLKSLAFPVILLIGYTVYGISNENGINKHLWAFIFCIFTLVYDIMEEYTWRGYLIESLGKINLIIKAVVSGIFWAIWHLLIFGDFKQYGGFGVFLIFCIVFSIILTFSASKSKAILVPATIHALLIRTNIVTLICFVLFMLILFTWNKIFTKEEQLSKAE